MFHVFGAVWVRSENAAGAGLAFPPGLFSQPLMHVAAAGRCLPINQRRPLQHRCRAATAGVRLVHGWCTAGARLRGKSVCPGVCSGVDPWGDTIDAHCVALPRLSATTDRRGQCLPGAPSAQGDSKPDGGGGAAQGLSAWGAFGSGGRRQNAGASVKARSTAKPCCLGPPNWGGALCPTCRKCRMAWGSG